jgi:hypothetical protein
VAARQPNNELVADLLARAGDPDIRQAAAMGNALALSIMSTALTATPVAPDRHRGAT